MLSRHVIASGFLGAVLYFITHSVPAAVSCFIGGIILDADHVIEYIIHYGLKDFSIRKVYAACESTGRQSRGVGFKKLYLLFHVNEVAIILWLLYLWFKNIYILSFAIGYTTHMLMDCLTNPLLPEAYFMAWRVKDNFDTNSLLRKEFRYKDSNNC
jgi:hypothetical protein